MTQQIPTYLSKLGETLIVVGGEAHENLDPILIQYSEDSILGFDRCGNKLRDRRIFPVGSYLDKKLVICSGYDPLRHLKTDCEVLEGDLSKITDTFEMWGGDHRLNSGHVRLNESTMLVTGGYDQLLYTQVSWTEFITANGMIPGNYLPITIAKHCMVQEMEGVVYLIGGNQDQGIWESPKTWIVELDAASNDFQVYEGPTLNEGREGHSCGTIKDKYGNVIIVVAGGQGKKSVEYLNTTDYIYPNWNWTMGKQPKE